MHDRIETIIRARDEAVAALDRAITRIIAARDAQVFAQLADVLRATRAR
ncbi:MAG TPA: hypothetical protein VML54_05810 [Candidatus Limnocylindrales bacterium]|nr:hypothetical protein [Candidatus Limnocylindrales bacterium]